MAEEDLTNEMDGSARRREEETQWARGQIVCVCESSLSLPTEFI